MRKIDSTDTWKVVPLASEEKLIYRSPDPSAIQFSHPSLVALSSGKLIASVSLHGPGVKKLHGAKGRHARHSHWLQGTLLISTDKGENWKEHFQYPFSHGCLFRDESRLYVLGHKGNLQLIQSNDGGENWTRPSEISALDEKGTRFHSGPQSILRTGDFFFGLCMALADSSTKNNRLLSPVLLRSRHGTDLTNARSWTSTSFPLNCGGGAPVPIYDEHHPWHQPDPSSVTILCRADRSKANTATVLKSTSAENDAMQTLSLPGGHLPFQIFYDEQTKLYFLLSYQSLDTLQTKRVPAHSVLRHLQFFFSNNLMDWRFAGLLCAEKHACQHPFVFPAGNDLILLYLTADNEGKHQRTQLMMRTIPHFRELVY